MNALVTAAEWLWAQVPTRFPDIKVAVEKRKAIYEALGLINEQLWLGHFEMWSGSGLVVFRHSTILDTREDEGLSLEQAEAIVGRFMACNDPFIVRLRHPLTLLMNQRT